MNRKLTSPKIFLLALSLTSPISADTIQCRAESASVIAELKSKSPGKIESNTLELARRAALMMCERKLGYEATIRKKNEGNPETVVNKLTAEVKPQEEEKRRSFLGLSFEKSERNKGHQRLQKRN
mgnify:CR=1 FL=1